MTSGLRLVVRAIWARTLAWLERAFAAVVIRFTGWTLVDPILAVLIGLWVLPRTWVLLREAVNVLLEGVPKGIVLAEVEAAMRAQPGVADVHDLHVWALASNRPALTAHVVAAADEDTDVLRRQLAVLLHERFSIGHATLQMEGDHCGDVGHCSGHDHHHDHEGHRH